MEIKISSVTIHDKILDAWEEMKSGFEYKNKEKAKINNKQSWSEKKSVNCLKY